MVRKSVQAAMDALNMRLVRPSRRPYYIARWDDPATGEPREQSTKQKHKVKALLAAGELALKLIEGHAPGTLKWDEFCRQHELMHIAHKSDSTSELWSLTKDHVNNLVAPKTLQQFDAAMVAHWQFKLRETGISETTIGIYSRQLRVALNWAAATGLIPQAPKVPIPKGRKARGREVRGEEFDRMVMNIPKVRPKDAAQIERFLHGLYLSGLRLDELRRLSWDTKEDIHLDTSSRLPVIRMMQRSHKGRRDVVQPITPEFWTLCAETPNGDRQGCVFRLKGRGKQQMAASTIGRIISKLGTKAGVLVDPQTRKCATAHDLRRSFCCNMDGRLTIAEMQKWMRHASIGTTMDYYHTKDAEQLMEKLWAHELSGASGGAPQDQPPEPQ